MRSVHRNGVEGKLIHVGSRRGVMAVAVMEMMVGEGGGDGFHNIAGVFMVFSEEKSSFLRGE